MEGFDWNGIIEIVIPAAGAVIIGVVAWGVVQIKKIVAATENKWDDELVRKVIDGVKKGDAE